MASMLLSVGPWITSSSMRVPHSSSTLTTSTPASLSFNCSSSNTRSSSLHSSFLSSPSSISFNSSSFSGLSLGLNLTAPALPNNLGGKRRLVVTAAGRSALCLTKRSRSRKSLARTHGFRKRMSTTNGIAVLKRRRAKGRKVLCTKTHSNSGK